MSLLLGRRDQLASLRAVKIALGAFHLKAALRSCSFGLGGAGVGDVEIMLQKLLHALFFTVNAGQILSSD